MSRKIKNIDNGGGDKMLVLWVKITNSIELDRAILRSQVYVR